MGAWKAMIFPTVAISYQSKAGKSMNKFEATPSF
jgi:hypothetical protein